MMATLVTIVQALAAIGYGAGLLRFMRIPMASNFALWLGLSFALGLGFIGWVLLPLALTVGLGSVSLGFVLVIGVASLLSLFPFSGLKMDHKPIDFMQVILIAALAVIFGFDLIEALTPPSDADSLAYHFALPKLFLQTGSVVFVPRAVDGATPLLVQMTYLPGLHFAGERGLSLWTLVSGWVAVGLLYAISREHLCRSWSLATAVLFASAPAVIYGAGSGQVEVRIALFVLLCAWSCAQFFKTQKVSYLVLAAIAAGLFGGAKVTGLIFMAAVLIVVLPRRMWFRTGLVFSIVSAGVAAPWYIWTYIHTGDPIFPILYPVLGVSNPLYWDQAHHDVFNLVFRSQETPLTINLFSLFALPVIGTLFPFPSMEAGRTGFGPLILVFLPCALALFWVGIQQRKISDIGVIALIAVAFYSMWFLSGAPQRVRHLLPVLPLIIMCLVFSAAWVAKTWRIKSVITGAAGLVMVIQIAGAALFGGQFWSAAIGNTSRTDFLHDSVSLYEPVPWINKNLNNTHKLMTPIRQQLFYLNVPYFFAHAYTQAEVDVSPEFGFDDLVPSLHRLEISHVLAYQEPINGQYQHGPGYQKLMIAGCLDPIHDGQSNVIRSRTLGGIPEQQPYTIFEFNQQACPPR